VTPVPRSLAGLTPGWLTAALGSGCPGAVVSAVSVGPVADGTNRRARVELAYAAGTGPAAVFVKIHGRPMHRSALVALGALTTEARLAASGVELPLPSPQWYAAAIDRSRLRTLVVMADVTDDGGRPNSALSALSVDAVRSGLAGLARLHAAYWDSPLPASLGFLRPWRLRAHWAPVSGASLAAGLAKLRRSPKLHALADGLGARRLEAQFRHSAAAAATGPLTVLHGDPHPGNTYALPGDATGLYDWQLARIGSWSHDVGYFVASSLGVDDRRAHERSLLDGYLDALRDAGVRHAPTSGAAWDRYRATPAYGLATWLHTLAAGSFQPQDVCLATIERFAAAYDDAR
jgi:Ser/Thr protein kinase RdoA (MazF antagonist)